MTKLYVILGMPGAGKDTQADLLAAATGARIIKTGELARQAALHDPVIDKALQIGELVSDGQINQMVEAELKHALKSEMVIFDGYPRHVGQSQWLDGVLGNLDEALAQVFYLELTRATAHARLSKRGRRDDTTDIVSRRLEVFEEETRPVIEYYGKQGKLVEVDGEGSIEAIHEHIMGIIK